MDIIEWVEPNDDDPDSWPDKPHVLITYSPEGSGKRYIGTGTWYTVEKYWGIAGMETYDSCRATVYAWAEVELYREEQAE